MKPSANSGRGVSPGNEEAAAAAAAASVGSDSGQLQWRPRVLAFQPFGATPGCGGEGRSRKFNEFRVAVSKPLLSRLTKDIVETYQICNPLLKYSEALNPKRFLTSPHAGVLNDGFDNANSDLILSVNFVLINEGSQQRYIVKDMLGQGTFGQVAKCWVSETNCYAAVKVIKNLPAYYNQAVHEVNILKVLNSNCDPNDSHHIVRMLDFFVFQRHLCISFEVLGSNLYELLKMNQLKGLSLNLVQMFSKQILHALIVMKDAGIIHCDLKPENILLWTSVKPTGVKVIDFGSACREGQTVYSYIQSRYYRSPEVLLGYPYTTAIDMWSFGCIVAELFLGLPLFPGASEYDMLKRMIAVMGGQPPDFLLKDAKSTTKFFTTTSNFRQSDNKEAYYGSTFSYHLLTEEEYEAKEQKKPAIGKWYFNFVKLEDIIADYPYRRNLSEEEKSKERLIRLALIDFVRGLVEFDPEKRWTPLQAFGHPFVTGEPFTHPYQPPPVTSYIPVIPNFTVHHRGHGHWLASGMSPQVSSLGQGYRHNSPHFQMMPFSHVSSYGSVGSYGSYGSYGDGNNMQAYFSPAGSSGLSIPLKMGGSALGASPEARCVPQYSHGNYSGRSPTGAFRPMSIGASPSQFTPPSTQVQISNSPGKYGPISPARGSIHGSPLAKAAVVSQYSKRRSWGHPTLPIQHPEDTSHHWHGNYSDGLSSSYPEAHSQGHVVSPRGAHLTCNQLKSKREKELPADQPESTSSLPDPGDWDPNYSDDFLLEEGSSEAGNLASGINNVHLGSLIDASALTSRSNHGGYMHGHAVLTSGSSKLGADGPVQPCTNAGSSQSSIHDMYSGPPISFQHHIPHLPQNSPSRFGQQPHRFNNEQQTPGRGDRNCHKSHLTKPNYRSADSHSVPSSTFGRGASWGQRAGYPITSIAQQPREPNGRIV